MFRTPSIWLGLIVASGALVATPANLASASDVVLDGTTVGGTLLRDEVWTAAGSPYVVNSTVVIPEDVSLEIEAGVEITASFLGDLFSVAGEVSVAGTVDSPVVFAPRPSSSIPTVFGHGRGAAGSVSINSARFVGVSRILSGAFSHFSLADSSVRASDQNFSQVQDLSLLRNSFSLGSNYESTLSVDPRHGSVDIRDNRLRSTEIACLGGDLRLRDNTFERLGISSIFAFFDGSGIDVYNSDCKVDARHNYWEQEGDLDNRIRDGHDVLGLPLVDISEKLNGPSLATPKLRPGWFGASMYVDVTQQGVRVSLSGSPNDGGSTLRYRWEAVPVGQSDPSATLWTETSQALIRDLDPRETFFIRVIAVNVEGESGGPVASRVQPVATVPSPPLDAKAFTGVRSATVAWNPPASDGFSAITGYIARTSDGHSCSTGAGASNCVIKNLPYGVEQQVTVTAVNAVGESAPSQQFATSPSGSVFSFESARLNVQENAGGLRVAIRRQDDISLPSSVNVSLNESSTAQPADFTTSLGRVAFQANQAVSYLELDVVDDKSAEPQEELILELSTAEVQTAVVNPESLSLTILASDQSVDGQIGLASGPLIGDGIVNRSGRHQSVTKVVGRRSDGTFTYVVRNTGNVRNRVRLCLGRYDRSSVGVSVRDGRRDVSALTKRTSGYEVVLAPSESRELKLRLAASPRARDGRSYPVPIQAYWDGDRVMADTVTATIRLRP